MALRNRKPPQPRPRTHGAIVAAAQPIKLDDEKTRAAWKSRTQSWQAEAWGYFDDIGEIKFAMGLVGNWGRKVRLFAAVQPDPDQPPTPVDAEDSGISPALAARANDEMDRLRSEDGTHGDLMAGLLVNFSVPGEAILLGEEATDEHPETWRIYSTDELKPDSSGKWAIYGSPGARDGRTLDTETTNAIRLWRQHPRFSDLADSNMRGVLDRCDELLILGKFIRAAARSRLNNGVWLWPMEVDPSADPTTDNAEGTDGPKGFDSFVADLIAALSEPIQNEGAASAVVPPIVRMPSEYIAAAAAGHITFNRPVDDQMAAQREECIGRIAAGLDFPAEVLLGLGTGHVNHWTADVIDDQTFKAHMQPLVELGCSALTKGYLAPALEDDFAQGGPRIFVWYDPSHLIGHPEPEKTALLLHDRLVISDDALRQRTGYSDDDAPDDAEREARSTRPPPRGQEQPAVVAATSRVVRPAALTAAASPVASLGERLAAIDRELTIRLTDAASTILTRALETAGAKLTSRAQGHPQLKARLAGVPRELVAATLGREAFATLGTNDDEILSASIGPLEARYQQLVRRAQQQARAEIGGFDGVDDQVLEREQDDHRAAGWLTLSAGMLALARERMFDPHPAAPPIGEHDTSINLPAGLIRESLSRAGGAVGHTTTGGAVIDPEGPAGGVATGTDVLQQLARAEVFVASYTWTTGSPDRPFEPHEVLDGFEFTSWDDEGLRNFDAFPDGEFFRPGDHRGCQCAAIPTLTQGREN